MTDITEVRYFKTAPGTFCTSGLVPTAWDLEERVCGDLLQHLSTQFYLEGRLHQIR